jgi:hypothetical protein
VARHRQAIAAEALQRDRLAFRAFGSVAAENAEDADVGKHIRLV